MSYRKSRHHRPDQIPAWAAWIVLGIFLLAYHLKVSVNLGDDASFVHALDNQNLISWSINQYHTWSSRTLIEAVMVTMRIYGPNLWRILNTGMYVLIGVLISRLFTEGTLGGNCVIAAGILMLFGWDLNDAGQIASSMNYIWPMGCALLAMIPMKRVYGVAENGFGKSHRGWEYLCLLPALYASNEEMTAVFVTGSAASRNFIQLLAGTKDPAISVGASGSWCFGIALYSQLSGQLHQICQGGSHLVSGIPGSAIWYQIKRWIFDSQLSDGEKRQLSVPVLRAFDDSGIFVYGKRIQNTS